MDPHEIDDRPDIPLRDFGLNDINGPPSLHRMLSPGWLRDKLKGRPWREWLISVAFFFSSVFSMTFFMNFSHYRMPDPTKSPPLPDIIHDILPPVQSGDWGELLFHSLTILTLASGAWYIRWNAFPHAIRFFVAWGLAWYVRTICLLSTNLPPTTDHYCRYAYPNYPHDFPHPIPNFYLNSLKGAISAGTANIHCGDLLFSGHTVLITMNWMFMITYMRHNPALPALSTLLALSKCLLIIVERKHYTIDVLISVYVSATCWWLTPEHLPAYLQCGWLRGLICRHKEKLPRDLPEV